ncbi:hypothetical protein RDI58_012914 [Solanum bulbocastanum]|uniref:Protein kinase domain-containing protein n=1 Tax=Solanum bulbocastanum TaxID=147425 RepID=A0AAN8YDL1_SOLBU
MGSKNSKATNSINDDLNSSYRVPFESYRVPFIDLQEATNNFDDKFFVGVGVFGKVYKGVLRDGTKVALKRRKPESSQGIEEFQTEIEILSFCSHPHLVSLIGYCDERNEMILVYDYMENGNLRSHLYGSDLPAMSWEQRLEICIGAARGLHYLHTSAVIHRDVKSINILLDENFVAKITDFGISKKGTELDQTHLSTLVQGTMGYLDPEYFIRGQLTEKSNVYSFGVVLFEVLCARPAIVQSLPREMVSLAEWAVESHNKGQLEQIIDPDVAAKIRPESLRKFGETAVKCLALSSEDRPSMGDVFEAFRSCDLVVSFRFCSTKQEQFAQSNTSCTPPWEPTLQEATNNFDDKFLIGEGGFGKVYRAVLCDGTNVALKRRKAESNQDLQEFQTEIEILTQFRHPHLVSLIGYCDENNELTLIYEYMENGTLRCHLYGSDLPTMSWEQRLEICIGAARGLHYLHTNSVIHRDVKSINILLDENFVAKITDFGISKKGTEPDQTHVTTIVKGTLAYLDPEYYQSSQLDRKI